MEADTSSDHRPVIQADEILTKIDRGEDVEYDGVIVEGNLDMRGLNIRYLGNTEEEKQSDKLKVIRSKITITNSEIRGIVNVSNASFPKPIHFAGTNFGRNVIFRITKFGGDTDFLGAKFSRKANFQSAEFGRDTSFRKAEFGGDTNFGKAEFCRNANFQGVEFTKSNAYFREAKFIGGFANFQEAKFTGGNANFHGAEFTGGFANFQKTEFVGGDANFQKAKFAGGNTYFERAEFGGNADFRRAEFTGGYAYFDGAEFCGDCKFGRAKFSGNVYFQRAEFGGNAYFRRADFGGNTNFDGTKFTGGKAEFDYLQFHRELSLKDTKFGHMRSQEVACRIAKRKMEDMGNKKDADDYFYREMEAVRIQNGIKGIKHRDYQSPSNIKEWLSLFRFKIVQIPSKIKRFVIYDVLEYIFIQRIFGYGVRPFNVAKAWLIVVFTLGFVYWIGSGVEKANNTLEWYEYFYFSIVTAATPGYAGYTPASGLYTFIAGAQAIFGTFMWAAFIATFARKWQR